MSRTTFRSGFQGDRTASNDSYWRVMAARTCASISRSCGPVGNSNTALRIRPEYFERRLVVRVDRRKAAPEVHAGAGKYAQQVRDLAFSHLDPIDQQRRARGGLVSLLNLHHDLMASRC